MESKIERYVTAVPKVELHVHLEGSIQPITLLTLAQRNGVPLPVQTAEEMQRWFTFRDFNHFIEIYFAISRCLKTAEDYELIVYEFGANMARQNVRYAEVTFSPSTHYFSLEVPFDTFFAGLTKGRQRAQTEFGVEIVAERQVPLELCHTSNICLGVYADIGIHPLPHLHAGGIPITLNSDDPPLFNTTLNHEVGLLFDIFKFDVNTANDILLNGLR